MKYFYRQSSWIDIDFVDLDVNLEPNQPAQDSFFEAFYNELVNRYKKFDELPTDYQKLKSLTAEAVSRIVDRDARIYSIGAGIGYVEQLLAEKFGFRSIAIWDPSRSTAQYELDSNITILDNNPLNDVESVLLDVVLGIQVTYAMTDALTLTFFEEARRSLIPGGCLILFNYSPRFAENSVSSSNSVSRLYFWTSSLKAAFASRFLGAISTLRLPISQGLQGWGWARDNKELRNLLNRSGFNEVIFHPLASQSVVIAKRP
jgi:SAM-dependent methyltransferase